MLRRFYHRTTNAAAREILEEGFQEGCPGTFIERGEDAGIWLTDQIVEHPEGLHAVLRVDIDLTDEEYQRFHVGAFDPRDFEVPAGVIRERGKVTRVTTYYLVRADMNLESIDDPEDEVEAPLEWAWRWVGLNLYRGSTEDDPVQSLSHMYRQAASR